MADDHVFPALLRYWRGRRGHSQLDLSLLAEVSARHIAFLEAGRSRPSEAMVHRLCVALDLPLRDRNVALRSTGFPARYPEPGLDALPPEVTAAIDRMMATHEPYPMMLVDREGRISRTNAGAQAVFPLFFAEPAATPDPLDMVSLLFDPRLMRSFVRDWERVAFAVMARLHREALKRPHDPAAADALERALRWPGVPAAWRTPDFSAPIGPTQIIALERGELVVAFLVAVTEFSAPGLVTLDELRIESCFPMDDDTHRLCERVATEH